MSERKQLLKSLGLTESANPIEIRSAYRKLARIYHPDLNNNSLYHSEHFREIQGAYHKLLTLRETTKQETNSKQKSAISLLPKLGELLRVFINKFHVANVEVHRIQLSVCEALKGCDKSIQIKDKNINIKVPALAHNGYLVKTNFGFRSCLITLIDIKPDRNLSIDARGVIINLPVTAIEALYGMKITVPTFRGFASLNLPQNVQSGTEMRLAGRGPLNQQGENSDLFFRIQINEEHVNNRNNLLRAVEG